MEQNNKEQQTEKMDWFIEKYNNNELTYEIANTNKNFGTIVMPTGTGKSGVIYEDCIYNIQHMRSGRKLIICICSHILNLNQQTYNAFFDVLNKCKGVLDSHKTLLILNSSDNEEKYANMTFGTNTKIKKLDALDSFETSNYDIAFVSSCKDSLEKFIAKKKILNKKNNIDIIVYIDECHTLIKNKSSFNNNINMTKLATNCYKLYGFSATPGYFVNLLNNIINKNKLNGSNNYVGEDECIIKMSPAEAINANIIVKPYVKFIHTTTGKLTSNVIISCMDNAIQSKNVDNHKLLVTCATREEATRLFNECEALGYKCFKNTSDDDWQIKNFCDEVENFDGNCIIFHCRKLIQGIDIKSITEAIIVNNNNGDNDNKTRIIQIIGRAIRIGSKDKRGMTYDKRIKKFANIYILSNGNEDYDRNISNIIIQYYGIDNIIYNDYIDNGFDGKSIIKFDSKNKGGQGRKNPIADLSKKISELTINFQKYLEDEIIPIAKEIIYNGGIIDVNVILNACDFTGMSDMNTLSLFDNADKIKQIKLTFKKFNISI